MHRLIPPRLRKRQIEKSVNTIWKEHDSEKLVLYYVPSFRVRKNLSSGWSEAIESQGDRTESQWWAEPLTSSGPSGQAHALWVSTTLSINKEGALYQTPAKCNTL
jgi:hypothetical protein